jgi:TetR/AcrR family transcriptional repressor of nem operon
MPRVSRQQTQANRATIEAASSRLFREQGFKAVSVNDLMAAAGLTHGGFYGHFASKDALMAIACDQAFAESAARWTARADGAAAAAAGDAAAAQAAFDDLVAGYLSPASRANAGSGCPATALAADVAREAAGAPVRAAYTAGIKQLLAQLARISEGADARARDERAMLSLATLVGALTLARATDGDPVADAIVATAVAALRAR